MAELSAVAPAFVAIAHRIVWCTVATVGPDGHPRTRILHPLWTWDGSALTGWIATGPTAVKKRALDANPEVSLTYWDPSHDTCTAECRTDWFFDDETCESVWLAFENAPAPVGYVPSIIPAWRDGPTSAAFAVLRLTPYRLRVFPGSALLSGEGDALRWHA